MESPKIKKSVDINASRENVWNVLLHDQHIRSWYAAFSEGAFAVTNWEEGGKVLFTDETKGGMVAKVLTNKPQEELSVVYEGILVDGQEDLESEEAQAVKGGMERYFLSPTQTGGTRLTIDTDMSEEYFEHMSNAWDQALEKIKELAEAQ